MGKIFISYRRTDGFSDAGEARSLFNALRDALGEETVFMDVDRISPGRQFVEVLGEALAQCAILIIVIGPKWLEALSARDSGEDFVRLEIETALSRRIMLVPVLVGGAKMPARHSLPDSIQGMSRFQAEPLTHEKWGRDVRDLIQQLADDAGLEIRSPQSARLATRNLLPEVPPTSVIDPIPPHKVSDCWREVHSVENPHTSGDGDYLTKGSIDDDELNSLFVRLYVGASHVYYFNDTEPMSKSAMRYGESIEIEIFNAEMVDSGWIYGTQRRGGVFSAVPKSSEFRKRNRILFPHRTFQILKSTPSPLCGMYKDTRGRMVAFPLQPGSSTYFQSQFASETWESTDLDSQIFGSHAQMSGDYLVLTQAHKAGNDGYYKERSHFKAPVFYINLKQHVVTKIDADDSSDFALYPDGSLVEVVHSNSEFSIFLRNKNSLFTRELIASVPRASSNLPMTDVSVSPSGKTVAFRSNSLITIVDLEDGTVSGEIFDATDPIFSPDGTRLLFLSDPKRTVTSKTAVISDTHGDSKIEIGKASRGYTIPSYHSAGIGQYIPAARWSADGRRVVLHDNYCLKYFELQY